MIKVCIGIATYLRPVMLKKALLSIEKLVIPSGYSVSVIVCDNDVSRSAKAVFDSVSVLIPFESIFLTQPVRGLSSVRNTILEKAVELGADFLTFFDDDEEVDTHWLENLLACQKAYNADVVAGRVVYQWPEDSDLLVSYKQVFARDNTQPSGVRVKDAATCNVLFRLEFISSVRLKFHTDLDLKGGEDMLFSKTLGKNGAKMVWCNEAVTYENLPLSRAQPEWIYGRKYRNGHSRVYVDRYLNGYWHSRLLGLRYFFKELLIMIFRAHTLLSADPYHKINLKANYMFMKGILHELVGTEHHEYSAIHGE